MLSISDGKIRKEAGVILAIKYYQVEIVCKDS